MRRTDTMATARDILIQNVSLGWCLVYFIDIYVFFYFSGRGGGCCRFVWELFIVAFEIHLLSLCRNGVEAG